MNFSIVIPTFNGEKKIEHCIRGLENLIIPKNYTYEIIFVDNNSTDNTINVINNSNLTNYKIVNEKIQGSFFTRNKGIEESSSNWVFCIDDDIEVQPNWVIEFFEIIKEKPNAGIIGAPLKFPNSYVIPDYIKRFETLFAITGEKLSISAKYGFLCSMLCINKDCYLFLKNNGFKQMFVGRGENGNLYASGEDIEYSLAVKYTNFSHEVTLKTFAIHYFDQNRLNFDYCFKIQKINGFTMSILGPLIHSSYPKFKNKSSYYYFLIKNIISLFKHEKTKEMDILYRAEKYELIKNLIKNKKEYQNYEKEIKNAKWNILNEKN